MRAETTDLLALYRGMSVDVLTGLRARYLLEQARPGEQRAYWTCRIDLITAILGARTKPPNPWAH